MLAYLAADIIFNQQYALDLQGHNYVTGKYNFSYFIHLLCPTKQ